MTEDIFSAIPHIPAEKFSLPDPWMLGDSWGDSEEEMLGVQDWFNRRAPGAFMVIAVDYGEAGGKNISAEGAPAVMYYLISKAEFESL